MVGFYLFLNLIINLVQRRRLFIIGKKNIFSQAHELFRSHKKSNFCRFILILDRIKLFTEKLFTQILAHLPIL